MKRPVRDDQHGTATGYAYGCRCELCREANSRYKGHAPVTECVSVRGEGKGQSSRCLDIAAQLGHAEAEFRRVAKLANRSEVAFRRYAGQLAEAKAARDNQRQKRDEHIVECDAATVRFGGAA